MPICDTIKSSSVKAFAEQNLLWLENQNLTHTEKTEEPVMANGRRVKKQHFWATTLNTLVPFLNSTPVLFSWLKVCQAIIRHHDTAQRFRFLAQFSVFQEREILYCINSSSHPMTFFSSTLNGELDASNQLRIIDFHLALSINSD